MSRRFDPDWRVAPGETIRDAIEEAGLDEEDLQRVLDDTLREKTFDAGELLDGRAHLTLDVALALTLLLPRITLQFWLGLEEHYRRPVTR